MHPQNKSTGVKWGGSEVRFPTLLVFTLWLGWLHLCCSCTVMRLIPILTSESQREVYFPTCWTTLQKHSGGKAIPSWHPVQVTRLSPGRTCKAQQTWESNLGSSYSANHWATKKQKLGQFKCVLESFLNSAPVVCTAATPTYSECHKCGQKPVCDIGWHFQGHLNVSRPSECVAVCVCLHEHSIVRQSIGLYKDISIGLWMKEEKKRVRQRQTH